MHCPRILWPLLVVAGSHAQSPQLGVTRSGCMCGGGGGGGGGYIYWYTYAGMRKYLDVDLQFPSSNGEVSPEQQSELFLCYHLRKESNSDHHSMLSMTPYRYTPR